MKLSLPWPQNSVETLFSPSSVLLHVIKTGLLTSMHEMSAHKCKNRPSGSNHSCVVCLAKHHLPRTRPHRGETQSRCLLFGNSCTVSSYTPHWLPQKNKKKHDQLHSGQRSNPSCMDLDFWGEVYWNNLTGFQKSCAEKQQHGSRWPQKERERESCEKSGSWIKGIFHSFVV